VIVLRTRAEIRAAIGQARSAGKGIGLVPTMGYLHRAHLSLVDRARTRADCTVLSIFVNPLQFGPNEDFARYPRDLERDIQLAEEGGVDIIFAPSDEEMYPQGDARVRVTPGAMAAHLCGAFRPGHFEGVLTVVAKLFNIVQPDIAVFGQKDFQQAALIRRMVQDLDFSVQVDVAPTGREEDGLALSSRNMLLSAAERTQAASLNRALRAAETLFEAGERDAVRLVARVRSELDAQPLVRAQYVELVDANELQPVERASPGDALALAAFLGSTRLIDNWILGSVDGTADGIFA
jgi:pantoate--beta-alanine ligase